MDPPSLELVFVKRYFNNLVDAECFKRPFQQGILLTGTFFTNGVEICEMATVRVKSSIWGRVINRRILFVPAYDPWQGSQHCVVVKRYTYWNAMYSDGVETKCVEMGQWRGQCVCFVKWFQNKGQHRRHGQVRIFFPRKTVRITEPRVLRNYPNPSVKNEFWEGILGKTDVVSNPFFGIGRVWYFQENRSNKNSKL